MLTLILLLIVIVLSIYNFIISKNAETFNNEQFYTGLEKYRIGDVVKNKGNGVYINGKKYKMPLKEYTLKYFPDSVASDYLRRTKKANDFKTLNNIIQSYQKSKTDCVIHIRAGDVIEENSWNEIEKRLNDTNIDSNHYYLKYLLPKSYYTNIVIPKLKKLGIKNIIIMSGSHIKYPNYDKSIRYCKIIGDLFKDFNVEYQFGNHPDTDIILGANAKVFVSSKGGYSRLIGNLNKINKNTTIGNF